MAKGKAMANVSIDFDAETAKLNKKTDEVNRRLARMEKKNQSFSKNLKNGFFAVTGAVVALSGAMKITKDIMASTQATGDRLVHTQASLKAGFESIFENIATLDFKGIAGDWEAATNAAYKYSMALDDIGDKSLAMEIRRSGVKLEMFENRYAIEKAITDERFDDALKLVDENKRMNQNLLNDEKSLLNDKLTAWDEYMMGRKRASKEEVETVKWVLANYDKIGDEMDKVNDLKKTAEGGTFRVGKMLIKISREAKKAAQEELDALTGVEEKYSDIWEIYNEMSDAKRQEYKNMLVEGDQLQQKAIKYLTTTETKELTILRYKEAQLKAARKLAELQAASNKSTPFSIPSSFDDLMQGKHNDVSSPSIGANSFALPEFDNSIEDAKELNEHLSKMQDLAFGITSAFGMMMDALEQSIIEGKAAWQDYAIGVIKSIRSVIMQLIALAVYNILSKSAEAGPIGALVGLGVAAVALTIASGLISKSQKENYHTGGIVPGSSSMSERTAMVKPGELYINEQQQAGLWNAISTGNYGGRGNSVEFGELRFGYDAIYVGYEIGAKNRRRK